MFLVIASLVGVSAALLVAVWLVLRWRSIAELQRIELLQRIDQLQLLLTATRQELERLKAVVSACESNPLRRSSTDPLEQMEQLADAASLISSQALDNASQSFAAMPAGFDPDLFTANHKLLAISRLIDQGCSASEIARRLNLPLGEVELLTSIRS